MLEQQQISNPPLNESLLNSNGNTSNAIGVPLEVATDSQRRKSTMTNAASPTKVSKPAHWFIILLLLIIGVTMCSFGATMIYLGKLDFYYNILISVIGGAFIISMIWGVVARRDILCCRNAEVANQPQTTANNKKERCKDIQNECEICLIPYWAILFCSLSIGLLTLSLFGFWKYNEDSRPDTYPFGICIVFGVCSLISFVISIFGFYHHCGLCCGRLIACYKFSSLYLTIILCIWDIISDILAATKVYSRHDIKFFWISVTFSTITFGVYQCIAIRELWKKDKFYGETAPILRWMYYIPGLSMIPLISTESGFSLIALAFSSFPQYVISLSFILEHNIVDTYNLAAIIMSTIQLFTSPFIAPSVGIIRSSDFVKDKLGDQVKFGCVLLFLYLTVLFPIIVLEMIHFCPILFEYYVYEGITYNQLVIYLLVFNVPKVLFFGLRMSIKDPGTGSIENYKFTNIVGNFIQLDSKDIGLYFEFGGAALLFIICFLVLPLVPLIIVIAHMMWDATFSSVNRGQITQATIQIIRSIQINCVILFVYLTIAYGYMGSMIWNVESGVGPITYSLLITTWGLGGWMLLNPIFLPLILIVYYLLSVRLGFMINLNTGQFEKNEKQSESVTDDELVKESVSLGFAMFTLCLGCKCCPYVQERLENGENKHNRQHVIVSERE